jgi:hypothetical protein
MRTDLPNRLKLLNAAATHDHEIFQSLKKELPDEARSTLGNEIQEQNIAEFNSYAYAEKIGCRAIYDSMYRLTSASVHTTPRCLEKYVESDAEGNILKIVHRSDVETTHRVLFDTAWFLLTSLEASCEVFSVSETDRLAALKEQLGALRAVLAARAPTNLMLQTEGKT